MTRSRTAGCQRLTAATDLVPRKRCCILFLLLAVALTQRGQTAEPNDIFQAGDRVAIVGNSFADLMHQHGYVETLLRHRLAERAILVRNFGWAGDTLTERARPANFASEDAWLSDYKADVILVCFGMGESFAGAVGLPAFEESLRGLIGHYQRQQYNGQGHPRLILVSPIAHEDVGSPGVDVARRNKELQSYANSMGRIADQLKVIFVDLFEPTRALLEEGGGSRLTSNGIHLTRYGYWVVSQFVAEKVARHGKPLRLIVDAASLQAESQTGESIQVFRQDLKWSWNVEPQGWPVPPPPPGSRVHRSLERFLDRLVVKSLPPGKYKLSFGSELPIVATAEQWTAGVSVCSSPRHASMEDYRRALNEKNLLHFHGWRALNQVHIVGQRKSSPSGRALPEEVAEWLRRAEEADERLAIPPNPSKNESWILERD